MKLNHPESSHQLEINDDSGLIKIIESLSSDKALKLNLDCKINLDINGKERRAPNGGVEHFDFETLSKVSISGSTKFNQTNAGLEWQIPVSIGGVNAFLIYRFNRTSAAFAFLIKFPGRQKCIIRNVHLFVNVGLPNDSWIVNIPGNGLRSNLPVEFLTKEIGVSPVGELRGSSSVIHFGSNNGDFIIWPNNRIEIPQIGLEYVAKNQIQLRIETNFSSDLNEVDEIELEVLKMDLSIPSYIKFAEVFQDWMRADGFVSPNNPPSWIKGAMIYEAQIGFSVFSEVNKYSPYPEAKDLVNDLDRIAKFGFTCIQLMPKQPYPSYNVHDYWDIDTSYGDKAQIKELVLQAHKRGIKVILDILLHGIMDQEIITVAADTVRSGPYGALIKSETGDNFSADVNDSANYYIAWSRHIIDFEKYWFEGSPAVSPLIKEHPDWFYLNSNGEVQGVYTKAFDARNRSWQDYFISACKFLMTELNVDGFRFDAPSYNNFPNWAPWARGRAGASALGCLGLFERLRPVMKDLNPQSLLYTEPSGHVFRQSMDLNYNYDEQWLVSFISDKNFQTSWGVRSARQLAEWVKERDRYLPNGSMTAHHIDSHDTFWWPTWGKKWRREQVGLEKVNLLTLLFGSLPGPFMMFSGGEIGIEALLPKLAKVKKSVTWTNGELDWFTSDQCPEDLFALKRTLGKNSLLVLVNFGETNLEWNHNYNNAEVSIEIEVGNKIKVEQEKFMIPALSGSVILLDGK